MTGVNRRTFFKAAGAAGLAAAAMGASPRRGIAAGQGPKRKFTLDLNCGAIGVRADQRKAIRLAHQFGFEAVDPDAGLLARLSDAELQELLADLKARKLTWGAAGLPVNFRGDRQTFRSGLAQLPQLVKGLRRAGVTRVGTWLMPCHPSLPYAENLRQHARRLAEVAKIFDGGGLRLGLEYVGPKTSRVREKHPFVHTMAQTKELIAAIGHDNVGLMLDSWHWYHARETAADLLKLQNKDVVSCHLNDAPAGIAIDRQSDGRRELPSATGVIDLKAFLGALVKIGYDGPIMAEPFSRELRAMSSDDAVAATAAAMRKAFALVQ